MKPEPRRCALYTRKSSDEGLDQAFNSLDAQREACAAYVAFLAPDLQRVILAGEQPERLTLARFLDNDLPLSWAAQRRMFAEIAAEHRHRRG